MPKLSRPRCPIHYVDDSADDHFLFQHAALKTGTPLRIQTFFSGDPALACLKGEPPFDDPTVYPHPNFLLCDYNLHAAKGWDLVATIRAISSCASLPVIMFSGSDGDDTVARSYAAGADHFLSKPSTSQRLEILVETLYACATSGPRCFDSLSRLQEYKRKPVSSPQVESLLTRLC